MKRPVAFGLAGLCAYLIATAALPILAASGGGSPPSIGTYNGIPPRALTAYQATDEWCDGLRWELVAAIGRVESGHGTSGGAKIDPDAGEATPWIFGPSLDGSPGVMALPIGEWV